MAIGPVEAQVMEPEVEVPAQPAFTAQSRCDRCKAQAFVRTLHIVDVDRELPLEWCVHHFRQHIDLLEPFVVLDDSAQVR